APATPPTSHDSEYTETTCARSQPKFSEIGFRKTVKLSPRPRPSTESAKHSASTLSATRAGFRGLCGASLPGSPLDVFLGVFWSIAGKGALFRRKEQGSRANTPMQ